VDLLAKERTRREFDRFVADHGGALLRTAYAITGDRGAAEDLVQDCLLRVAGRWPRVRAMDKPLAYARRVLVNLALDGSKHRTRRARELVEAQRPTPIGPSEHEPPDRDQHVDLMRALYELPLRQRTMVVLRYLEDLSESDVADVLHCSRGTVKSTTSRALERVRRILEERPRAPGVQQPLGRSERSNE